MFGTAIHEQTAANRRSGLLLGVEPSRAVTAGKDAGSPSLDPLQRWLVRCTREAIRVNWHRAGGCALPARFRLRIRRQGFLGRLCRARYKSTQPTNKLTL